VDRKTENSVTFPFAENFSPDSAKIAACMYAAILCTIYLSCPTAWNLFIGLKIKDLPNEVTPRW
jgi:hypothetical protein